MPMLVSAPSCSSRAGGTLRLFCATVCLGVVLCACKANTTSSAAHAGNGPTQDPSRCEALVNQAKQDMGGVAAANLACSKDDDCVVVEMHADCFDMCTTVISKAGQPAFEQARQRANQGPCAEFTRSGCGGSVPPTPPPCAPANPPRCVSGSCTTEHGG